MDDDDQNESDDDDDMDDKSDVMVIMIVIVLIFLMMLTVMIIFDTHQIFRRNGREKAILSSRQTIAKAEAIGAEKFQFEVSFFFIFVN